MICNVCLPLLKDFLQDKNKLICRFSPFWITKKLEVRQNRGLHLHFYMTHLPALTPVSDFLMKTTLFGLQTALSSSADNAHAIHPNHQDCSDPVNHPYLNGGIVIKFNANQKYCTDGFSSAVFRDLCRTVNVPVQTFVNRSDMAGGSTLGNISNTQVAVDTVDIGLPQLAMHSPYETAGVYDTDYLSKLQPNFSVEQRKKSKNIKIFQNKEGGYK